MSFDEDDDDAIINETCKFSFLIFVFGSMLFSSFRWQTIDCIFSAPQVSCNGCVCVCDIWYRISWMKREKNERKRKNRQKSIKKTKQSHNSISYVSVTLKTLSSHTALLTQLFVARTVVPCSTPRTKWKPHETKINGFKCRFRWILCFFFRRCCRFVFFSLLWMTVCYLCDSTRTYFIITHAYIRPEFESVQINYSYSILNEIKA